MKKILFIVSICAFLLPSTIALAEWPAACPENTNCVERLVTESDSDLDGSLRDVIMHACLDNGDDAIQFGITEAIELEEPIVIPASCNGKLFIYGRAGGRNLISGADVEIENPSAPNCLIRVESNENYFSRLNIIDYSDSNESRRTSNPAIGICLIGNKNTLIDSTIGVIDAGNFARGNDVGIFISGSENQIANNHVSQNNLDGIQITGNSNILKGNFIGLAIENCGKPVYTPEVAQNKSPLTGDVPQGEAEEGAGQDAVPSAPAGGCQLMPDRRDGKGCQLISNQRYGILIYGDAKNNIIKGDAKEEYNTIQLNGTAGIRLTGSAASTGNLLSPNIFNRNWGLGIDLASEGVTPNDDGDLDAGPNDILNSPEILLVHVRNRFDGNEIKTVKVYGKAPAGKKVEFYIGDTLELEGLAEGKQYITNTTLPANDDNYEVEIKDIKIGSSLAAVTIDEENNTSEFCPIMIVEIDSDFDGIIDRIEDLNGNGLVDREESDPFVADTDDDGLVDSFEDLNRNGKKDAGELATFIDDLDDDLLGDFVETHGDGKFNPENGDTNPFKPDTDCDGAMDGEEDANQNGIAELYLSETFPQFSDTGVGCE